MIVHDDWAVSAAPYHIHPRHVGALSHCLVACMAAVWYLPLERRYMHFCASHSSSKLCETHTRCTRWPVECGCSALARLCRVWCCLLRCRAVVTGALTAEDPKPLPAELEAFVQSAGEAGVVYASLGVSATAGGLPSKGGTATPMPALGTLSVTPVEALASSCNPLSHVAVDWKPPSLCCGPVHVAIAVCGLAEMHELTAIRDGLAAIAPVKVIWKLHPSDLVALNETGAHLDIPANVKVAHFVPQNSLLGHPQVKAFASQGGTNSFLEVGFS